MSKTVKRKLTVIISMILVLAMLGSSYAWADSPDTEQNLDIMEGDAEFGMETNGSEEPHGNRTEVVTYYNASGGSCGTSYTYNTAGAPYGWMPTPYKSGYTFVGWFEHANYEGYEYTENTIVPYISKTLYAHWASPGSIICYDSVQYLNMFGESSGVVYDYRNVTLWASTGSNDQKWLVSQRASQVYVRSYVDKRFGLNVYRHIDDPYNCNMYPIIGNETDASVDFIASFYGYLIKLHNYDRYLTAVGDTSVGYGYNVRWVTYTGNDQQIWL